MPNFWVLVEFSLASCLDQKGNQWQVKALGHQMEVDSICILFDTDM